MPGPVSLPDGPKARWEELNEIVCDFHYHCDMDEKKQHSFITYRMWLLKRNRPLARR